MGRQVRPETCAHFGTLSRRSCGWLGNGVPKPLCRLATARAGVRSNGIKPGELAAGGGGDAAAVGSCGRRRAVKPPLERRAVRMAVGTQLAGQKDMPLQQKALSGLLGLSSLPYSSYLRSPQTFLHRVDARIKQAGVVLIIWSLVGGSQVRQATIALSLLTLTMATLPRRTWSQQLRPVAIMGIFYFIITSLFADGAPPVTQTRSLPTSMDATLLPIAADSRYSYVIFRFLFLTVTQKSVKLAVSTVCLIFVALQSASLCLTTTPPEELAFSLRWFLRPWEAIGMPVKEITLTLLLSLRFLTVAFDEVRNLALGVAVRGLNWRALGLGGSLRVLGGAIVQLFRKLFSTCENVAQAMQARGFIGPQTHRLYLMESQQVDVVANVLAIVGLGALLGLTRLI